MNGMEVEPGMNILAPGLLISAINLGCCSGCEGFSAGMEVIEPAVFDTETVGTKDTDDDIPVNVGTPELMRLVVRELRNDKGLVVTGGEELIGGEIPRGIAALLTWEGTVITA